VREVRSAIGSRVRLGIDANGAWTPGKAIEMIRCLEEFDLWFAEQPVPPGDMEWLAHVRSNIGVPIIAAESLYSPAAGFGLIRAKAADVFSVYVGKSAGIGPSRRIGAIADAAGVPCTIGSNLEMGVGSAAMIHLAMSTPAFGTADYPCDIIGPFFYTEDLLKAPLDIRNGEARPPSGPGLGVELDPEKMRR